MAFRKNEHTVRKLAIGSAIAGVAGYLTGVLTAPKSGKETRHDIADKADDVKQSVEDQLGEIDGELNELIKTAKQKTVSLSSSARADFNEAVIKAKDAQNKTGQILKAAKAGQASDPDLNKAVKQASQAANNLKKFYKN